MLALLLFACAAPADSAVPEVPPDYPDTVYYIPAGRVTVLDMPSTWATRTECDDAEALTVRVGDRLCSVSGGVVLDVDGDGLCDLSPPVDLTVSVWR